MDLYGYYLNPVQLFASTLARYRAFGLSNIQLYAIFKTGCMCLWETILVVGYVQRL